MKGSHHIHYHHHPHPLHPILLSMFQDVPRKEFVDMPLGVSEADGRPGAGVHFDGFTYQGE